MTPAARYKEIRAKVSKIDAQYNGNGLYNLASQLAYSEKKANATQARGVQTSECVSCEFIVGASSGGRYGHERLSGACGSSEEVEQDTTIYEDPFSSSYVDVGDMVDPLALNEQLSHQQSVLQAKLDEIESSKQVMAQRLEEMEERERVERAKLELKQEQYQMEQKNAKDLFRKELDEFSQEGTVKELVEELTKETLVQVKAALRGVPLGMLTRNYHGHV